ncbi:hypothetical protein [Flavobacterium sp. GT3R68]|uniref:hypothetical protein n=1 Tax=Flavobacterium sp. GT3R68 TaxID=2594437 RepID=UPI000F873470|nr:hypothetical protein [Flavobacterium sp. GT3R68]RTY90898.1 hypothetical protein EKL32_19750 [Flavobacterium sp. GSN2]TRW90461.1 hypothetical protein FNW07_10530 [Flavobacterium sp. GT3R68]
MRNLTVYLSLILCLFLNKMTAQETFEEKAKIIAAKIEQITKDEKTALKLEIESVNAQLQSGKITNAEADAKKVEYAEMRAKNIERRVDAVQEELKELVQQKVDGKIKEQDTARRYSFSFPGMKVKDRHRASLGEKRTTSQFVFAAGFNNLVTNEQVAHSDFRYFGSHFYEWGLTYNSRILKNNNLLHAKYGLSVMYNNLRPTDNRYFVASGDQTTLATASINLEDSRLRNVYLVVPMHLEFDFSKNKTVNDKTVFQSHDGFRIGLGGYAGARIKSKQILEYENTDGNDVRERTKGDFNASDFIYGVSSYIGYKETSLYIKYDLNPLFEDNVVKQNNISLGIRFDLN